MNPIDGSHDSGKTGNLQRSGFLVAAGVALASVAFQLTPGWAEALQWHRQGDSIVGFLDWFTGHMTHWSWDHLVWDLVAFLVLSFAALRLLPGRYLACLGIAAGLIPLEIFINQSQFETYRGLSGIDSALFGLIVVGLWRAAHRSEKFPLNRILAIAGGAAFFGKVGYEALSGGTLFVSTHTYSFVPAVSAHLTGMVCGLIAGVFPIGRTGKLFDFRGDFRQSA